ncbi:MAG TPA: hypothetical protein VFW00_04250 [Rhodocyclaceae bacterium]|nr:hypothetical protein [Rhodocyclaceae bacterium]
MFVKVWRFMTLLLVALLTGLAFAHVLERPVKLHYDAATYIYLQQTLYKEWGPPNAGGILEPMAILATCILAAVTRGMRVEFLLALAAAIALLIAFPIVFFVFVAPANEIFRAATPTSIPSNWMDLRASWETGHSIRFVFQLIAFMLLLASTLVEHPQRAKLARLSKDALTKLKTSLPRNGNPITVTAPDVPLRERHPNKQVVWRVK